MLYTPKVKQTFGVHICQGDCLFLLLIAVVKRRHFLFGFLRNLRRDFTIISNERIVIIKDSFLITKRFSAPTSKPRISLNDIMYILLGRRITEIRTIRAIKYIIRFKAAFFVNHRRLFALRYELLRFD